MLSLARGREYRSLPGLVGAAESVEEFVGEEIETWVEEYLHLTDWRWGQIEGCRISFNATLIFL